MAPRSSGRVGTLLLCDPAWFEPRLEVEPRAHGARLSIHAVAVVAGGQAWAGCRGDSVGQEAMKAFQPSLGQEDRSAPVRVCCVRSVCLLGRERVTALLTLDLLALVSAPDPQAGRAAGAEGDEVRWDVIQRRSSRVPQDRRSSSPCSIVIPV